MRVMAPGNRLLRLLCLFCLGATSACSPKPVPGYPTVTVTPHTYSYLALGDSYTTGEGVAAEKRWPVQLAGLLGEQGYNVGEPRIVARTGWTTGELQAAIEKEDLPQTYDLVSLLIGVNNQYRGYSLEGYRQEFAGLLEQAIMFAGGDPRRVLVLSIPDWSVTPYAEGRDREAIAAAIDAFNRANREETEKQGASYIDVTPTSRQAAQDLSLIAPDGLHPSGLMYAEWVRLALPAALLALKASE
jgi:lysophospholipase L1-like esterase